MRSAGEPFRAPVSNGRTACSASMRSWRIWRGCIPALLDREKARTQHNDLIRTHHWHGHQLTRCVIGRKPFEYRFRPRARLIWIEDGYAGDTRPAVLEIGAIYGVGRDRHPDVGAD